MIVHQKMVLDMTLEIVKSNILQLKLEKQAELMHFMVDWLANANLSERREQYLVHKIKDGGPALNFYDRHDELLLKSAEGKMTEVENQELQRLVPIFDQWGVERAQLLIELAKIWSISPQEVMEKLNLQISSTVYV